MDLARMTNAMTKLAPRTKKGRSSSLESKKGRPEDRLAPAARVEQLKTLLHAGWTTCADVQERLEVSRATAYRLLNVAETLGPLERDTVSGTLSYRFRPGGRVEPLRVSTSEMVAMMFVRNALQFLAGTGITEDLDAVFDRVTHALKKGDYALYKNLDRKLHDVNEHAYDYGDRLDIVNDILTALLREERLRVDFHDGHGHVVEPYTLLLFKKGLYLIGFSHKHAAVRSFSSS